jgi:dipeptidyl aminopeptidase/acylaminoacyl peptidase
MRFDLDHYLSLPRVQDLKLSPDGTRLVTAVATVGPDGKKFVTALWELDPAGVRAPRRLTRSAPGESGAAFLPDGSLLFRSSRPDPDEKPGAKDDREEDAPLLWLLPADGGEARPVAAFPAGIGEVKVAADSGLVVFATGLHPGASGAAEEGERTKARKDAGVTAQLFEFFPIRFWDHYLGPRERNLFAAAPPSPQPGDDPEAGLGEPHLLTPAPGQALDTAGFDVAADGRTVYTGWRSTDPNSISAQIVAIDVAGGDRTVLVDEPGILAQAPVVSPDGNLLAWTRETPGDTELSPLIGLRILDLRTAESSDPLPGFELWPHGVVWAPDSSALFFVADQEGFAPVFRLDLNGPAAGTLTRLTTDGSYDQLNPSPDGTRVFALRATMSGPAEAVVLDARTADQTATALPTPGLPLEVPSRLDVVEATAADGTRVRSWLVLPEGASGNDPAPLVVFIHGGPLSSWNAWSWRWNPHLLAARGYAVLLPDPALSTGYGTGYVNRGRGSWGEEPYTDLMAAVDACVARPDVDETRTAAMGGSFGGYMANWVAGHTDRFKCIVTHASLWSLEQFHGTTDEPVYWRLEFGDPEGDTARYRANSPDAFADRIRTPMLVIHGELDHRVPIGEALRLWTDLNRHGVEAKFLYFPNENHWILKPPNIRVWYETVFAFLDQHVLGKDWVRPTLL